MAVRKTARMLQTEEHFREPLEALIPRLFEETGGNHNQMAKRLGVSWATLWGWMGVLGIKVSKEIVQVA